MESKVVIKKVPVKGKNGLYSIIPTKNSYKVKSISEIVEILERPLPRLKSDSNTTAPKAFEITSSDK